MSKYVIIPHRPNLRDPWTLPPQIGNIMGPEQYFKTKVLAQGYPSLNRFKVQPSPPIVTAPRDPSLPEPIAIPEGASYDAIRESIEAMNAAKELEEQRRKQENQANFYRLNTDPLKIMNFGLMDAVYPIIAIRKL
jgi:hypothetical protein